MSLYNTALGWAGLAFQTQNSKRLTGSEREMLNWNALQAQLNRWWQEDQALLNREFQSQEAAIARDWQEMMYTQYQSPAAMMRQYQEAGLNPALMYGSASSGSIPSATSPSGAMPSSNAPSSGLPVRATNIMDSFLKLAQLDAQIENVNADTMQKLSSAEQTKVSTEFDTRSMQNRLSLLQKELRDYDTRDRLNISSIRINDVSADKIISETNKNLVEMATEQLKQENIEITNQKLAEDILLLQLERGLKILDKELRGKQITSQELSNIRQSWENQFKDEVGFSPDQPIWNAVTSLAGSTAMRLSDVVENIVSWFNKRK